MFSFTVTELYSVKVNLMYKMTELHMWFFKSLIFQNRVTELRLVLVLRSRVTEFALFCFCGTGRQNFALHCFHGSDCQRFTLKSVTSLMRLGALVKGSSQAISASRPRDFQGSSTRTEQGIGLLTIPVLVAGGQFGQAKFALSIDSISPGQATSVN